MSHLFNLCLYKRETTICALTTFFLSKTHSSSNEEIEWDSSSVWNYTIGRVVEFKKDEKRVAEILKSKNKPHGFCIGESWPINDTIWNEEEESVPSGIFIPKRYVFSSSYRDFHTQ
ncbi:uncharacterized protein LOC143251234 [Tachypleus tridentatus]|uniref:uncharacterized protein LOC143251234 n=1 Tax=Tachypleus tridentatus TaxID=6853 RepID=UPI003FD09500